MNDIEAYRPTSRFSRLGFAVVGMLALFFPFVSGGCGSSDPTVIRCATPVGEVADFSLFEWDGEMPEGGYFQVAVYIENSGAPLGPVRRSPELHEPRWAPREHDVQRFPDKILWRVFAVTADRKTIARGKAIASRE